MTIPRRLQEKRDELEVWRPIPDYEELYEVSSFGRVRRIRFINHHSNKPIDPRILTLTKCKFGYMRTALCKNSKVKHLFVHRLVLEAFVGPRENDKEVAHLNGIRTDNRVNNLEWTTRKENHAHKKMHGTFQSGENQKSAKLKFQDVQKIRELRKNGLKLQEIGDIYNISDSQISAICNNKSWINGNFDIKAKNALQSIEEFLNEK